MSYDLEELRGGIVELFADAVGMSPYRANFGELPSRTGLSDAYRAQRRAQYTGRTEAERERRRKRRRRALEADREMRIAERTMQDAKFSMRPTSSGIGVPWPHYRCDRCCSTAPTHRCPG